MRRARITCLTRMVHIPDLGLQLTKGDTVELSEGDVQGSQNLRLLRKVNAVRLDWLPGEHKKPVIKALFHMVVSPVAPSAPQETSVPDTPTWVDIEDLADKIASRLREEVKQKKPRKVKRKKKK